uniref:Putative secreted protein n=1 Tax=Anopheles darlingi TaxID=43151 RepID=A0A2M4D6L0_ANODA
MLFFVVVIVIVVVVVAVGVIGSSTVPILRCPFRCPIALSSGLVYSCSGCCCCNTSSATAACCSTRNTFRYLRIVSFKPIRTTTVNDLLPEPHQPDEGEERTGNDEATAEHIDRNVVRGEHIDRQGQHHLDRAGKQEAVGPVRRQRYDAEPGECHERVVDPVFDGRSDGAEQSLGHVLERQHPWHVGRVDGREGEPVAAQLAVLFARVAHPLHEAVLVDPFDASGADARMKKRSIGLRLTATHSTNVALHLDTSGGGYTQTHDSGPRIPGYLLLLLLL